MFVQWVPLPGILARFSDAVVDLAVAPSLPKIFLWGSHFDSLCPANSRNKLSIICDCPDLLKCNNQKKYIYHLHLSLASLEQVPNFSAKWLSPREKVVDTELLKVSHIYPHCEQSTRIKKSVTHLQKDEFDWSGFSKTIAGCKSARKCILLYFWTLVSSRN